MQAFHPNGIEGYKLFHAGTLALADVQENGIYVDSRYFRRQKKKIDKELDKLITRIERRKEVKHWKKKYGSDYNLESNPQLGYVLFDYLKLSAEVLTSKGNPSTNQEALEKIKHPLVKDVMSLRKKRKISSTYLANYIKEQVDNFIHPFFNLHNVITFRGSSSNINFQNQPNRDEEFKKLCRRGIKPRPGRMIGEVDFSGVEVSIAACYHKDPTMIKDIMDPEKDMHRDMAIECFLLGKDQWNKPLRQASKNQFVFPEFYGSYFKQCAEGLWDYVGLLDIKTADNIPVKEHLKSQGIRNYHMFEKHIEQVEDYFWNERYPIYNKWREAHWKKYQQQGYVDLKTGFRCSGDIRKNQAINFPVQGAAFHCLLWCLIQLNDWLKLHEMETCIIGQIHDSIILDIEPMEMQVVMDKVHEIMEVEILEHWKWIIIPLSVEAEVTPIDKAWYYKKEIKKLDFECDCGNDWMWETKDGDKLEWECPICQEEYLEAA